MNVFVRISTFLLSICFGFTCFAHPLDVTKHEITIRGGKVQVSSKIHVFQMQYFYDRLGTDKELSNISYFRSHPDPFYEYFKKNFSLKHTSQNCKLETLEMPQILEYEIITEGFPLESAWDCGESIKELNIRIDMFKEFSLQTHQITIFEDSVLKAYKVLTPKVPEFNYTVGMALTSLDTDSDGLSDEDEKIYGTNPRDSDTDKDHYLDGEEVHSGFPPLSPQLGPGQVYREKSVSTTKNPSGQNTNFFQNIFPSSDFLPSLAQLYKIGLQKIQLTTQNGSIWDLFLTSGIIFIFGILHTLGPGHGKAVLIPQAVLQKTTLKRYGPIWLFSFLHVGDVVLLVLLSGFIAKIIPSDKLLTGIQIFTGIGLVCVSIWMLFRILFPAKQEASYAGYLQSSWISGLLPCSFSWGIFFLLTSLGYHYYILWYLLVLALSIALTLSASVYLAQKGYNKWIEPREKKWFFWIPPLFLLSLGIYQLSIFG